VYVLAAGQPAQVGAVHRIVLFDPGNTTDFTNGSCDTHYNINALLANWLRSNTSNQLWVLTGLNSEEKPRRCNWVTCQGRATFHGLWTYHFAGIWNQPFAGQATVCDYNNLGHQATLSDFASIVQHPQSTCPTAAGAPSPTAWHP